MVPELIARLDRAHQTVDELVKVQREYGLDYSREKAYTEDVDTQIAQAAQARQAQAQPGRTTNAGQNSTLGGQESTSMKTGKLNNSAWPKGGGSTIDEER